MRKLEIKSGDRYGILTVIKEIKSKFSSSGKRIRMILCLCDCGKQKQVYLNGVRTNRTISCGCARIKRIVNFNKNGGHYIKHGMYGSPEYRSWNNMKNRCNNPNTPNYEKYGKQGIKICERWNNFENFYKDMGKRPEGTSLGRINSKGNYEFDNCRWETYIEQNNNLSNNRIIQYKGKSQSVSSWARELGIGSEMIRSRLFLGWDPIRALTELKAKRFRN